MVAQPVLFPVNGPLADKRPLRDYQSACISSVINTVEKPQPDGLRNLYYVLPTGTGKTRVATGLVEHFMQRGRVLVVAHRKELIEQMAQAILDDVYDSDVGVCMADQNDTTSTVVVGSIQTLRTDRLQQVLHGGNIGPFVAILIDECHHVTPTNSYAQLINTVRETYPDIAVIGCTATPYRSDKSNMTDVLTDCVFNRSIPDMVDAGWLSPVVWSPLKIEMNTSTLGTSVLSGEKDYKAEDIASQLSPESLNIAQHTMTRIGDRPCIVFAATVSHAEELCEAFNTCKPGSATYIEGEMSKYEREYRLVCWKRGSVQTMINVGILTEGFDYVPVKPNREGLAAMVIARPTMSPSLYLQMLGRGTRLKPADALYKDCIVIDCVGNANLLESNQITLPRVMPSFDEEVIQHAKDGTPIRLLKKRDKDKDRKPYSFKINESGKVSWINWGMNERIYFSGLGNSPNSRDYIVMIPTNEGLYRGFVVQQSTQSWAWSHQELTPRPLLLAELMQHVNLLIAKTGRRSLLDKDAAWRGRAPSERALAFLRKLDKADFQLALMQHWTGGDVSNACNWHVLKKQIGGIV